MPAWTRVWLTAFIVFGILSLLHLVGVQNSKDYRKSFTFQSGLKEESANATFVILARNIDGLLSSLRSLEGRFNKRYHYPYVFLNNEPFSARFERAMRKVTSGKCEFGLIDAADWEEPAWIDQDRAARVRETADYIYGDSQSYRRMCHYQSGGFFKHPLMLKYEYYWRVEPNVKFFCDIDYDPFAFMVRHRKVYGFTMALLELESTVKSLWKTTRQFMQRHPEFIAPTPYTATAHTLLMDRHNSLPFVSDDDGKTYNLCHFWSNFEIASMTWLRSKPYQTYFDFLDQAGGFFYERHGDAPVHSIAASILLETEQIHHFDDIGYQHDDKFNCPYDAKKRKCDCDPAQSYDILYPQCIDRWKNNVSSVDLQLPGYHPVVPHPDKKRALH